MRDAAENGVDAVVVSGTDRKGRFAIVQNLWGSLDRNIKDMFLNDEHPHVRSAARIKESCCNTE